MSTVALLGAGGKMGQRIGRNLRRTDHTIIHVEPAPAAQSTLAAEGIDTVALDEAVAAADAVILAVPDNRIGQVAASFIGKVRPGTTIIVLDAAAPFAGQLPVRDDITYIACHPCHPPLFGDETSPEARTDYFGAIAAKQNVVVALIQGPEEHYEPAAELVKDMFAPVMEAFRITLDDMVLLEPVLAETTAATCISVIREALDEAIDRGVPAAAARAFLLGHIQIELAILFDELGSPFSDGALKAIDAAKSEIFQPDWRKVFEPENVRRSVANIVA